MEPVTHILTGACLSRAGLNRRAAYATLAMAIGAEFPDIDTVWTFAGPVASFTHHRGITHTFVGLPFEAGIIVAGIYAAHRIRMRRARKMSTAAPLTAAPVAWGALYGFTLIALLSHLLLDFTNNYGIRPFFPFNPHWYAASITFIFDPLIFVLLLLPFAMPPLFALVGADMGARRQPFRGRGWAIAALTLIACSWAFRAVEHAKALQIADTQSIAAPSADAPVDTPPNYLRPLHTLANPDPLNPFLWHMVTDFGPFYQLAEAHLLNASIVPEQAIYRKPESTPALLAAEASPLGRAYMDWSPLPLLTESRPGDATRPPVEDNSSFDPGHTETTLITFRDPRFMGNVLFMRSQGRSPLTGTVEVDAGNRVMSQALDGRSQH